MTYEKSHMEIHCFISLCKNTREFGWKCLSWMDNAHPRSQRLLNKITSTRCWTPPCKLLSKGSPRTTQTRQDTAIALGHSPELDGKIVLLKTLHALVTGHKEITHELNSNLLPYWLGYMI